MQSKTGPCTILFALFAITRLSLCTTFAAEMPPTAAPEKVVLPDGTLFPFWDDRTAYRKIYHVAGRNPQASDANPGTQEKPFKTINRAADVLEPGEKVSLEDAG